MAYVEPPYNCPGNGGGTHEPVKVDSEPLRTYQWLCNNTDVAVARMKSCVCKHCGVVYCEGYDTEAAQP